MSLETGLDCIGNMVLTGIAATGLTVAIYGILQARNINKITVANNTDFDVKVNKWGYKVDVHVEGEPDKNIDDINWSYRVPEECGWPSQAYVNSLPARIQLVTKTHAIDLNLATGEPLEPLAKPSRIPVEY